MERVRASFRAEARSAKALSFRAEARSAKALSFRAEARSAKVLSFRAEARSAGGEESHSSRPGGPSTGMSAIPRLRLRCALAPLGMTHLAILRLRAFRVTL